MKRVVGTRVSVNTATGEERLDGILYNKKLSNESHVSLYQTSIVLTDKLTGAAEFKILNRLFFLTEFNSSTLLLTSDRKEQICLELGISKSYLYRVIKKFKELGIIQMQGKTMKLNKELTWRGAAYIR